MSKMVERCVWGQFARVALLARYSDRCFGGDEKMEEVTGAAGLLWW